MYRKEGRDVVDMSSWRHEAVTTKGRLDLKRASVSEVGLGIVARAREASVVQIFDIETSFTPPRHPILASLTLRYGNGYDIAVEFDSRRQSATRQDQL